MVIFARSPEALAAPFSITAPPPDAMPCRPCPYGQWIRHTHTPQSFESISRKCDGQVARAPVAWGEAGVQTVRSWSMAGMAGVVGASAPGLFLY
eukprot:scaffold3738_cov129-Isochrysis_galbana.AAC.3